MSEQNKINRCQICGARVPLLQSDGGFCFVCRSCGAHAEKSPNYDEAVLRWNNLEIKADVDTYSCEACTNKRTPICETCSVVAHPDGTTSRPGNFCELGECDISELTDNRKKSLKQDIAEFVKKRMESGEAIPVALIMLYNNIPDKPQATENQE